MEKPKKTKVSEQLRIKTWVKTMTCYCKALKETYPEELKDFSDEQMKEQGCDRLMRIELMNKELPSQTPEIHRLYMKHMLELPSKVLETIIELDRQDITRRASYTIDEIMYELLDRAVKDSETKGKA